MTSPRQIPAPRVLVVCARRYNGHELWTALGIMQEQEIDFEVVSQALHIEDEVTGQPNVLNRLVYDVRLEEVGTVFNALMIVSGNMQDTERYWKDKHVLDLVKAFNALSRPISAICCSVPTIREVAEGKAVSFFPLIRSRELLGNAGAILKKVAWTVDQNLVTAEHQMATQVWAGHFCDMLFGKPPPEPLVDSGYMPKGRKMRTPEIVMRMRGPQKDS